MQTTVSAITITALLGGAVALTSLPPQAGAVPKAATAPVAPPPQPSVPGELKFLDASFPVTAVGADGRLTATVFVSNTTAMKIRPTLSLTLRSSIGKTVKATRMSANGEIPNDGSPTALTVEATLDKEPPDHFPLSGWLTLTSKAADGTPVANGTKTLQIASIDRRNDDGVEWPILSASFGWAMVTLVPVGLFVVFTDVRRVLLRMGSPSWSFNESWSSNLTIAGTVLASFLSFAGLPDYGHLMSKKTYTIASLLFAALIMLAPSVYSLFRKTTQVKNDAGVMVPQTQGIVLFFLAAAALTTTGVLAQLQLLGTLFDDLATASIIARHTAEVFGIACLVLEAVLVVYASASTYMTVKEQIEVHENHVAAVAAQTTAVTTAVTTAGIAPPAPIAPPQLPDWTLL